MNTPQVGQDITVVMNSPAMLGGFEQRTYTGKVLPCGWLRPGQFALSAHEPMCPQFNMRVLEMKYVVSINGQEKVAGAAEPSITTEIITGSKGGQYVLTKEDGKAIHCTCPGFLYRHGQCRHVSGQPASPKAPKQPVIKVSKVSKTSANPVSKLDQCRALYVQSDKTRQGCLRLFMNRLGMKAATASTYYQMIKKENE